MLVKICLPPPPHLSLPLATHELFSRVSHSWLIPTPGLQAKNQGKGTKDQNKHSFEVTFSQEEPQVKILSNVVFQIPKNLNMGFRQVYDFFLLQALY